MRVSASVSKSYLQICVETLLFVYHIKTYLTGIPQGETPKEVVKKPFLCCFITTRAEGGLGLRLDSISSCAWNREKEGARRRGGAGNLDLANNLRSRT